MSPFSLVIPIILALTAAGLILLFFGLIVNASSGYVRTTLRKHRFKKRLRSLLKADELLQQNDLRAALPMLKTAFILERIEYDPLVIEQIYTHHLGVLSRMVTIAEQRGIRLSSLPLLEDLLQNRTELMKSQHHILTERLAVSDKQRKKGKETPTWAADEFDRRIKSLHAELEENRTAILSHLDGIIDSILSRGGTGEVTYH